VGKGTKENESSTLRVWAAGFHYVTVRSRLVRDLKIMKSLFFQSFKIFQFAVKRGKLKPRVLDPRIRGPPVLLQKKVLGAHSKYRKYKGIYSSR
jgi:hypothetical protein